MEKPEEKLETIRTLRGDIEGMVRDNQVSVVSVVAQEADKKSGAASREEAARAKATRSRFLFFGILLLVLGVGGAALLYTLFAQPVGEEVVTTLPQQLVVTTQVEPISKVELASVLLERPQGPVAYVPGEGDPFTPLSVTEVLNALFPGVTERLTRSVGPRYTILITPQGPAVLFEVSAYERAYSETLSWERTSLATTLQNLFGTAGTTTPYTDTIILNLDVRTNGDTLYTFQTDRLLIFTTHEVLPTIIPLLRGV